MYNILILILIFILVILHFKYGEKSKYGKIALTPCHDQTLIAAFNKAFSRNITGFEFFNELLRAESYTSYKVRVTNKKYSEVQPTKKVMLGEEFNNNLNIDTFQTALHELQHVRDRKLLLLNLIPLTVFAICYLLFALKLLLFAFDNFGVTNQYLQLINYYQLSIIVVGLCSLILATVICIVLEKRAILNVPQTASKYLLNLSKEEVKDIMHYIMHRAENTVVYYTAGILFTNIIMVTALTVIAIIFK